LELLGGDIWSLLRLYHEEEGGTLPMLIASQVEDEGGAGDYMWDHYRNVREHGQGRAMPRAIELSKGKNVIRGFVQLVR
jgi:hypothetical protein